MEAGELILDAARREVHLRARPPSRDLAEVKVATLGPSPASSAPPPSPGTPPPESTCLAAEEMPLS